ncbi:MAG: ATP-binding protein [Kofleriaceae bacterium]|nr:ATP-binding protein [Kofleriaceae bacterium]
MRTGLRPPHPSLHSPLTCSSSTSWAACRCDSRAADILYAIISRRHERASTIITTNLAFKRWGTVFPWRRLRRRPRRPLRAALSPRRDHRPLLARQAPPGPRRQADAPPRPATT